VTRKINIEDVEIALQSMTDITPDSFDGDALIALFGFASGVVDVIKESTNKQEESIKLGVFLGTMLSVGYQLGKFENTADVTPSKMAC
jgi:hypothetical protein